MALVSQYEKGISLYDEGEYKEAIEILEPLGDYKDSISIIKDAGDKIEEQKQKEDNQQKYQYAEDYFNRGEYAKALELFDELGEYTDSATRASRIRSIINTIDNNEKVYLEAQSLYDQKEYIKAQKLFYDISDYKDSGEYIILCSVNQIRLDHAMTISGILGTPEIKET